MCPFELPHCNQSVNLDSLITAVRLYVDVGAVIIWGVVRKADRLGKNNDTLQKPRPHLGYKPTKR